jgi:hypothetical protein
MTAHLNHVEEELFSESEPKAAPSLAEALAV